MLHIEKMPPERIPEYREMFEGYMRAAQELTGKANPNTSELACVVGLLRTASAILICQDDHAFVELVMPIIGATSYDDALTKAMDLSSFVLAKRPATANA
jgi:hypothetical protein